MDDNAYVTSAVAPTASTTDDAMAVRCRLRKPTCPLPESPSRHPAISCRAATMLQVCPFTFHTRVAKTPPMR